MEVLWDHEPATVAEVCAQLSRFGLAYNSVLTTLRILERKGYASHRKQGRAFVYRSLVDRNGARNQALRHLLNRFFQGSPELLVQNLLDNSNLSETELSELRTQLEEHPQTEFDSPGPEQIPAQSENGETEE